MSFFSTKSLTLSDFEQFSDRSEFQDEAMIGRSVFSLFSKNRFKAISSLSFQRYSGETASVVQDFKKALSQKYGAAITNFVFSQQHEQAALLQGLSKKIIAAVLKKAAILKELHFLSYRQFLQTKQNVAIQVVKKLQGTPCYAAALKKYQAIQAQLQEFDEVLAHFEPNVTSRKLFFEKVQRDFQEKRMNIEGLTQSIMVLSDAEEKMKKIFGDSERSQEMLKVFLQHQRVMEELQEQVQGTWRTVAPEEVVTGITKTLDPLIRVIEKAAAVLSSFSVYFKEEDKTNYFSLNQRGEVIVQNQAEKSDSVRKAQEHAARIFFDALKECYGADFINGLRPPENQNQPLTVSEAVEIFKNIHTTFKNLGAFFKKQPLLITKEYLDILIAHPHLAEQMRRDYEELGPQEGSLLQRFQNTIDFGMLLGADCIPSWASSHFLTGHLAAVGVTGVGMIGVVVLSALAGRLIMVMRGHENLQTQAAGVSVVFVMEGILGEIATKIIFPHQHGIAMWAFIRDILTKNSISKIIACGVDASAVAKATLNAFVGGSISGALATREEIRDVETSPLHAERDHHQINVEHEVSFEGKGFRLVGIDIHAVQSMAWKTAVNSLEKLVEAMNRIPITP